jgi:uncharacterized protein (TIGR04551 family)
LGLSSTAWAQVSPTGPGLPTGTGQQEEEDKPEGIAEAAPKTPGLLPTTPVLPAPKNRRKRWKLFELDGYYRVRTDWLKNLHLGFNDDPAEGGAPFPLALACKVGGSQTSPKPCDDDVQGANMRLRLNPTFNIDEGTSVFTQIDLLDNVVFGSTPESMRLDGAAGDPPLGPFDDTQAPPQAGVNSDRDSIVVRRAWAEVALPLGILKFGRMPNHWGMGVMSNSGDEDPFNGGVDLDADYGDTVDRVSFSTIIPGTRLRGGIASDWGSTRLISNQTDVDRGGQPWDLDDNDDANQWVLTMSRLDNPTVFKDTVARGEIAFNYGIYFGYRTQKWDHDTSEIVVGQPHDPAKYVQRGYKAYIFDPWMRAAYKQLQLELEGIAILGGIDHLEDYGLTGRVTLRQYGGVARFTFTGLDDKLRLGMEAGAASGDQYDGKSAAEGGRGHGDTHISNANLVGAVGDSEISRFIFDRDYKIDMILFRELIGAVTNAAYARPFLSYELTKSIKMKVANITSFALKPVAMPGNEMLIGTEFNADLGYTNGGFHAGIAYGVLFPLGAMNHPADDPLDSGPGYGFGTTNVGDAGNAHTIQTRLVLSF